MAGQAYWVIVECQNFAASIFDTQDLSTIRGGSLLLRDRISVAKTWLQGKLGEQAVEDATLGGSTGIWRVTLKDETPEKLVSGLRAALGEDDGQHAAYAVAMIKETEGVGYSAHRDRLFAATQRQRLAQARLPFPKIADAEAKVCPVDFVRPVAKGTAQKIGPGLTIHTSASVYDRRKLGREKKQTLVREEVDPGQASLSEAAKKWLTTEATHPFAMQIASISEGDGLEKLKSNLQDKICVIALDGNGFGKIQDAALKADDKVETQQAFDGQLAKLRSVIIGSVFDKLVELKGFGAPCAEELEVRKEMRLAEPEVLRLEVLLWGGDEIMFIVPARTGWRILETIGRTVEASDLDGKKISFAVGAVFCHHDAPIARIKELADGLAGHIKGLKEDEDGFDGKAGTHFVVEVLESFDHIGRDVKAHLMSRVPKAIEGATSEALPAVDRRPSAVQLLTLPEVTALQAAALALQSGKGGKLSRGRLRETARVLQTGRAQGLEYRKNWAAYVRDSHARLSGKVAKDAVSLLGAERFFALVDAYWDYLTPEKLPDAKTGDA